MSGRFYCCGFNWMRYMKACERCGEDRHLRNSSWCLEEDTTLSLPSVLQTIIPVRFQSQTNMTLIQSCYRKLFQWNGQYYTRVKMTWSSMLIMRDVGKRRTKVILKASQFGLRLKAYNKKFYWNIINIWKMQTPWLSIKVN